MNFYCQYASHMCYIYICNHCYIFLFFTMLLWEFWRELNLFVRSTNRSGYLIKLLNNKEKDGNCNQSKKKIVLIKIVDKNRYINSVLKTVLFFESRITTIKFSALPLDNYSRNIYLSCLTKDCRTIAKYLSFLVE